MTGAISPHRSISGGGGVGNHRLRGVSSYWRSFVYSSRSVGRGSLRVGGNSFVGDISNVSGGSVHGVVDDLGPAVRQQDAVGPGRGGPVTLLDLPRQQLVHAL